MSEINLAFIFMAGLALFVVIAAVKTILIVPQRTAVVVERLGKYSRTLEAGFHILIPFIDKAAYSHSLKEVAADVPEQNCVTKDNIQIKVDGVIYMQVVNPHDASYGIADYQFAATQLAQTTLRSVVGKIELDKAFEERESINTNVVNALEQAAATWGVKVLRYEVANIELPGTILGALETQMRAERERRAAVAEAEGQRESKIRISEGDMQEAINLSEGEKQRQINVAQGRAEEIRLLATATAEGIKLVAKAITEDGGKEAVSLRIAEQYVKEFGNLAKETNTLILPAELSNIGGAVAAFGTMLNHSQKNTSQ